MDTLAGKVVAITGSASGIGRALALDLAQRGCHLALSDVDEDGLARVRDEAGGHGVQITTNVVDVANRDSVYAWADQTVADHGRVNVIINNAGVALTGTIEELGLEDIEWLMGINFWGVVYGTKAFLPHLRDSGDGHVVNLSSVFGMIGVPTQGAYNAAKFAVRGFTECLRQELKIDRAPVAVTCVQPGGIRTNIARAARVRGQAVEKRDRMVKTFDAAARTSPEQAAQRIITGILRREPRVLIGGDARLIDVMQRLLPTGYSSITRRLASRADRGK
jgi:NAD(P)-dependent dehydrogenase (short-subunit alcohol dehydrogenase family)